MCTGEYIHVTSAQTSGTFSQSEIMLNYPVKQYIPFSPLFQLILKSEVNADNNSMARRELLYYYIILRQEKIKKSK